MKAAALGQASTAPLLAAGQGFRQASFFKALLLVRASSGLFKFLHNLVEIEGRGFLTNRKLLEAL
jgi:hypothetical protein